MSLLFLLFLTVLQGITELFPISSLGHTMLIPGLVGVHLGRDMPQVVPFVVALHFGTAIALLWYFRVRWIALFKGWIASLRGQKNDDGHLAWALVIGTIPAGLIGLLFEKRLEYLFHDLRIIAVAMILNGILLWVGDFWQRRRSPSTTPTKLSFKSAALIGIAQVGALIPGFSRSGLTLLAGIRLGLSAEKAAEFSFLLGTPIIFAAGLLELPKLFMGSQSQLMLAGIGALLTAVTAYFSVRFLMHYLSGKGRLAWFGLYCVGLGTLSLAWFIAVPGLA